jgi:hypothetical protein
VSAIPYLKNYVKIDKKIKFYNFFHRKNIKINIHIAPPSITYPFSIFGSTTLKKGGENGKLSGNAMCNRICGIPNSLKSWANNESGSM